jgi:aspartyl aminopeptidase
MGIKLIDHKGFDPRQLERISPSTYRISQKTRSSLDALVNRYIQFLDKVRINSEVTEEMIKLAKKKGFFENKKNFKVENLDKTALALIKPGKKSIKEGLRIIYTHTDSPCLQIKPVPVRSELDFDMQDLHLGSELSVIPYGGLAPYHWVARPYEVRGWMVKKGQRRKIKFNAYVSDFSVHIDKRNYNETNFSNAFSWESVRLVTGHESEKKLLEWLKFESRNDFARARLYAVPKTKTEKLPAGDYILGYGHDDRAPTHTALEALLSANPTYTAMVIGFDKEEIGSKGDGGAESIFFERIIEETIVRELKINPEKLPLGLIQKIMRNSYAISGDVDVGPSLIEAEDSEGVDFKSIPKLGHGVNINTHDGGWETHQISVAYVDKIICLMEKEKIRHQVNGCSHDADNFEGQGYHAEALTNRGIPTIEMGIPTNSLHSHTELIHGGDLYWMKQAYKAFLEDKGK